MESEDSTLVSDILLDAIAEIGKRGIGADEMFYGLVDTAVFIAIKHGETDALMNMIGRVAWRYAQWKDGEFPVIVSED